MARENQGLQIALIIFVMLTIVLGVTTFIFFQKCDEANQKAAKAEEDAKEKQVEKNRFEEDMNKMKQLIGHPETKGFDEIKTRFDEDMKKYAGNFPEEARSYTAVLPFLYKTIDEKSAELVAGSDKMQELKDTIIALEKTKEPQVAQALAAAKAAKDDLLKATTDFNTRRQAIITDQTQLQTQMAQARKNSTTQIAQMEEKLQDTTVRLQKLAAINKEKSSQLRDLTAETFEVPDGEIRWVNQANGTVWINLGRDDSLQRQTTFSVYPMDTSNLANAGKKASIEVTQILGPHTAEARIVEDAMTNPIMPGDKIHTPVWSRGEQRHFALAGLIDLNGDGKGDQATVHNLITMNGGVIDCEADENGKKSGQITASTRYLVIGKAPDERGNPNVIAAYSRMITEAEQFGVEKITLAQLLQKMGWKNQTPVVQFGRGSNPNDFRAKSTDDSGRVSTGSVSDLFREKRPAPKPVGKGGAF